MPLVVNNNNKPPAGFVDAPEEYTYRMILSTQGKEKTGKTSFALSAPGPIALISFDVGLEGVVQKYTKEKKVWIAEYHLPTLTGDPSKDKITCDKQWNQARDSFNHALHNRDVRSLVIDTSDELWSVVQLAEFGKIGGGQRLGQLAYKTINQNYRSLILSAYETDKSIVLIHKVEPLWATKQITTLEGVKEQRSWDGVSYARAGFKEGGFLCQSNLEHYYENGTFGVRVLDCRQNMKIQSLTFENEDCNFSTLAQAVFPSSKSSDWE
jgi:hypothetical protein